RAGHPASRFLSESISTSRLLLRPWRTEDRDPFAEMGRDPEVMEHFRSVLTREESDGLVDRVEAHFIKHGFGLWAVEIPGSATFPGILGLMVPSWEAQFTPCVEIGWRFARRFWGRGFATEGASAVLDFGFNNLGLHEIVSFAVVRNLRSIAVMQRIGMIF